MRSKNMMTIEELVKTGKMESSIEFPLKRLTVVNVVVMVVSNVQS